MGLEILIASRGEFSLITEVHAGLHVDLDNREAALQTILKTAAETPFAGILGCDDTTVELAAMAAAKLRLPHNPVEAARRSHRKDLARAHLKQAGCPVPEHVLVDLEAPLEEQLSGLDWPCVIKPLNMSASRGVIRANNPSEFILACERIRPILVEQTDPFEQRHVLVEQYIDGFEVAFEGYLHAGQLHELVIFDKPEPLTGPYFEETIYVTPSRLPDSIQQTIHETVAGACKAYGLVTGPVHAELRIDGENAWILEVAARTIGGDCARTLDSGMGYSIESLTIALACNRPVNVEPVQHARGVMMIPVPAAGLLRRVEGLSQAREVRHVDRVDIAIPEGHELVPLPEGNRYPGYIFASAETPEQVIDALKKAHARLRLVTAPVWKLAESGTRQ